MQRLIFTAALAAAGSLSCGHQVAAPLPPASAPPAAASSPAPSTRPTPASSPAASPTPTPRPWVRPIGYTWEPQPADPVLDAELRALRTPEAMAAWLVSWARWTDTYDLTLYFAPSTFRRQGWGSCTAHARMWERWARLNRTRAYVVAFWAPHIRAHAVAIFEWPRLREWRTGSNALYDPTPLAKPGDTYRGAAAAAAASDWSGGTWVRAEVNREADGAVIEELWRDSIPIP